MIAHYATSYQTHEFCAAYRLGVLTVVRLRDNASVTLSLADTNLFRIRVQNYELTSTDLRDPVDKACDHVAYRLKPRKWIRASLGGAVIEFHNEPVRREANA